jgi:Tripartite tricarboxylate transporter TctB family
VSSPAPAAGRTAGPKFLQHVRRPGALAIDVVVLLVLLGLLPETLGLGEGARRFPLVLMVVTVLLVCLDAAIELFPAVRRRTRFLEADFVEVDLDSVAPPAAPPAEGDPVPHDPEPEPEQPRFRALRTWEAVAWLTGLGVAMYFLGYVVATPIFLALFFLWARVPIRIAVTITVVMTALNYFVFYDYLGLR